MSCRLVLACRHLMAYRVSEMLGGAGKDEVLLHWAAAKISASPSVPDGALKAALAAKVSLMDRPKYAPLAAHAQVGQAHSCAPLATRKQPRPGSLLRCVAVAVYGQRAGGRNLCARTSLGSACWCAFCCATMRQALSCMWLCVCVCVTRLLSVCDAVLQSVGRRSLAIKLLEEEPSAAQQVPLLISLAKGATTSSSAGGQSAADASGGESAEDTLSRALRKAVDARDPDLVYLALFAAYRSRPLPEFWKMVGPRPTARNLFVKYTRVKVCCWLRSMVT